MPSVPLTPPPNLGNNPKYRDFKGWLLSNFFDHICCFCLLRDRGVQVEHYEPQKFAPERVHDPTNLLLACSACNGPGGKSDYHPAHAGRWRMSKDTRGHLVLDVRADDFASLMRLEVDGQLLPHGDERDRAAWNIALLKLDLLAEERKELLDLVEGAEIALEFLAESDEETLEMRAVLELITPELAARILLLEVLDTPMSDALVEHLRASGVRLLRDR